VPGVAAAEVWNGLGTTVVLANGVERYVHLWGLPPDSAMVRPRVISGRWLRPGDGYAIVLNAKIATEEGVHIGDRITWALGNRETVWTVVGLIVNASNAHRACFVPYGALARETGTVSRGRIVRVQAQNHDTRSQQALMRDLRQAYAACNIDVRVMQSAAEEREQTRSMFDILTYLMLTMTTLAAAVGGIGLTGALSINIVERRREIGVMRAIGATSPAISGLFIAEGIVLGVLSWLVAVPLSYPAAQVISDAVGYSFMGAALEFRYSASGAMLWLATVVALSALASLWPARQATKVSVRQALAYE